MANDDGRRTASTEPPTGAPVTGQPGTDRPNDRASADEPLAVIGDLAIRRRSGPAARRGPTVGDDLAAYESADGSFVVATSRAYLRTEPPTSVETLAEDLARLGLRVDHVPSYAPHTGYVRGDAGAAARHLDELRVLPGVRSVEVELLRARQLRDASPADPSAPPAGRGVPRRPPMAPSRG